MIRQLFIYLLKEKTMGQIFNRISRIIDSYSIDTDSTPHVKMHDDGDELKRIIDELNAKKSASGAKQNNSNSGRRTQTETGDDRNSKNKNVVFDEAWAYSILGTNASASPEEIKKAYIVKVKEYHPDKVSGLGEELKTLAESKTKDINKAFEIIKKSRGI